METPHPIALRRTELGLTGYALARMVGITPTHLAEIEAGQIKAPRVDLAIRIADALQSDIRDLFEKTEAA